LAQAMDTRISLLSRIGYIPSYKPKNPKPVPKLLESERAWQRLVHNVQDYIASLKAKDKGQVVKPFFIAIVNTS
ncbi:hypothetical protein C0992_002058, partial [Termitomyces sp. T32_za158]